jgi:hypothetical protein
MLADAGVVVMVQSDNAGHVGLGIPAPVLGPSRGCVVAILNGVIGLALLSFLCFRC